MNNVVCNVVAANLVCIHNSLTTELLTKASVCASLRQSAQDASGILDSMPLALSEVQLQRTLMLFRSWLSTATELGERIADSLIGRMRPLHRRLLDEGGCSLPEVGRGVQ